MLRLLQTRLFRPYRRPLLILTFLSLVQATATLTLPTLSGEIIDEGVLRADSGFIRVTGAEMLGFSLIQIVFAAGAVWVAARTAMSFGRDVRRQLFTRVTEFSAREVGALGASSLITRITNDVQQVQQLVMMGCVVLVQAPIMMVVGVVMSVREDVGLSVVLVIVIPLAIVSFGIVISRMVPAFTEMQTRLDHVNQVMREQLTGLRVIRAFVREPEETARFDAANHDLTAVALRAGYLQAAIFPVIVALINAGSVLVLWIGASRIDSGELAVGSLVAFLSYLVQILIAVAMTSFVVGMSPRAAVSARRIMDVLDTDTSVHPSPAPVTDPPQRATIELRDAGFGYPGAEHSVLSGISFRVDPGTTTAIVGSTGSGKTTLVRLIPRLADVTEGAVLVDSVDVRDLHLRTLGSIIGLVPQKPYLFGGTIRSNLAFGKSDATDEEMWTALEVAQAADFVRQRPDGLDTPVEQGGTNLSGGQRQRICIARALVRRPEIYLFDDSFSALDMATDARLRRALKPYTAESAVVIVAQRVSTVMDADQIIVLDDGRIVGRGDHEQLLASCPTYVEIVDSQLGVREAS